MLKLSVRASLGAITRCYTYHLLFKYLAKANFAKANLANAKLAKAKLANAKLANAKLANAKLAKANFAKPHQSLARLTSKLSRES